MEEILKDILEKTAIALGIIVWGVVYLGVLHIVLIIGQPSYLGSIFFWVAWTLVWGPIGISAIFYFETKRPVKSSC